MIVECKANRAGVALDPMAVSKFFGETVPAFVSHHRLSYTTECRAEIWTTGAVGDDTLSQMAELPRRKSVVPALVYGSGLEEKVPESMPSCRRLLRTIAAAGP